jgi:hypothetical protein
VRVRLGRVCWNSAKSPLDLTKSASGKPGAAHQCVVVGSPGSASRATFALKSTEYRIRLPVVQVRPTQEQTELKPLSELQGPPHSSVSVITIVLDSFESWFNVGSAESQSEAGHGNRVQAVRRPDDVGNGD